MNWTLLLVTVALSIITLTGSVARLVKASVVLVMFVAWILAWLCIWVEHAI